MSCRYIPWEEANQRIARHATPYHAPVYLAQKLGYFQDEGIKVALLEPNDPSGLSPVLCTVYCDPSNLGAMQMLPRSSDQEKSTWVSRP